MRASIATAFFALATAVMGWEVTLYSESDCNDHNGDFSYMIVEGSGPLPYCIGPGGNDFPPGVICRFYGNGGAYNEECKGQINTFKSWYIRRGNFNWWAKWDGDAAQPDNLRCTGKYAGYGDGEVFKPENGRCRNTYYHNYVNVWGINYKQEKVDAPIMGISAWDAA